MMIALHYRSLSYDPDKLNTEELETIRATVNEASSGTVFPWGYGGHRRTAFGIHFEDAWMPSANLHVAGEPKVWLFIRRDDFQRLYEILSRAYLLSSIIHANIFSQRSSSLVSPFTDPFSSIRPSSSDTK
jgi:hypothetical protein